jgi:RHH-type proline utilization regulon transcriptional repressor/proline dehydrogenase/delta 1-pyrroline-5-carboxylate dehydrogenase
LQSYLPDSFSIQQELTQWAKKRLAKGGASVKIRIVKGANLAMEQVESSLRGWPQAPYRTKAEVDVNFKRMVDFGCEPSNAEAVHLGIASHNLFDIAYALLLRSHHNVERQVCFEMLEGMADHQRRVVQQLSHNMLLYCPAAERTEFQNAVAYLVRRLDENTAPENFLRDAFEMVPGNKTWQIQKVLFSRACDPSEHVGTNPQRFQNRQEEPRELSYNGPFENEADTDWALVKNCEWALNILEEWKTKKIPTIPLSIGDEEISDH